jgi:hypothetical protein
MNSGTNTSLRYGFFVERTDPPPENTAGFAEGITIYGANLNGSVQESNIRIQGGIRKTAIIGSVSVITTRSTFRASSNSYFWIRDNIFTGQGGWIGPQKDGGLSSSQADDTTSFLVLENNRFNNSHLLFNNGLQQSVVRNNLFDWTHVTFPKAVFLNQDSGAGNAMGDDQVVKNTKIRDVVIAHNTFLNPKILNSSRPRFIEYSRASASDNEVRLLNLTVANNLVAFTAGTPSTPVEIVKLSGTISNALRTAYSDEIRGTGTSGGRWKVRDNVWSTDSIVTIQSSTQSLSTWNSFYVNHDNTVPNGDLDRASSVTAQIVIGTERFIPISADASKVNIGNRALPTYISGSPQVVALLDSLDNTRPSTPSVTVGQTELNPL